MKTLGVDLASQANRTATCMIQWSDDQALVADLNLGADDATVLGLAHDADAIGIDAPFGWPDAFVSMLTGGADLPTWTPEHRDSLRFRTTDIYVHQETGRWPLSVSSDLIGVVAMRCRGLLHHLGIQEDLHHPNIFEVYPAAALRRWEMNPPSYKGAKRRDALADLVAATTSLMPWLSVPAAERELLGHSDDAFDAFLSSLITRAAITGRCDPPPDDSRVHSEGWIYLPTAGSLQTLHSSPAGATE